MPIRIGQVVKKLQDALIIKNTKVKKKVKL